MAIERLINPYRLFHGAYVPEWLLMRSTADISQGSKLCYGRLLRFAGKTGVARPFEHELGVAVGVVDRQVRRYIDELERLELIWIVRGRIGVRPAYYFPLHPWMNLPAELVRTIPTIAPQDRSVRCEQPRLFESPRPQQIADRQHSAAEQSRLAREARQREAKKLAEEEQRTRALVQSLPPDQLELFKSEVVREMPFCFDAGDDPIENPVLRAVIYERVLAATSNGRSN